MYAKRGSKASTAKKKSSILKPRAKRSRSNNRRNRDSNWYAECFRKKDALPMRFSWCVERRPERGCCSPPRMATIPDPWSDCPVIPPCLVPMRNPPCPKRPICARPPPKKVCINGRIEKIPQPPYEWWSEDVLHEEVEAPCKIFLTPDHSYPYPFYDSTYFVPEGKTKDCTVMPYPQPNASPLEVVTELSLPPRAYYPEYYPSTLYFPPIYPSVVSEIDLPPPHYSVSLHPHDDLPLYPPISYDDLYD